MAEQDMAPDDLGRIENKRCSTCGEYSAATRHLRGDKYDYWVMEECHHTYYTRRRPASPTPESAP